MRRVLVTPTLFRAAGERILLCQLEPASTVVARSDDWSDELAQLYHEGVDGIVFTDAEGNLRAANEAFLNLTDTANFPAIRGRSLADFLARGEVDLRLLLDNVKRTGQLKFYATRLSTEFSRQVSVEISATWLNDRPDPVLVLVFRDASRAEAMRRSHFPGQDDGSGNVMELVGSSPLKDGVDRKQATADLRAASGLAGCETNRNEGAPIPLHPLDCWDNGRDVVLAGDAAGVVAPSSGEGIYCAMVGGRIAAKAARAFLNSRQIKDLCLARKLFMKEHKTVFKVLRSMQDAYYKSDERRERFVSLCHDEDAQKLTFEAC